MTIIGPEIVAFIQAQLDEDERRATKARSDAGACWPDGAVSVSLDDDADHDGSFETKAVANHVTRHDPGRVLRGIAAKRQIVNLYDTTGVVVPASAWGNEDQARRTPHLILRLLASEWSDRADYQAAEWRP